MKDFCRPILLADDIGRLYRSSDFPLRIYCIVADAKRSERDWCEQTTGWLLLELCPQ